ncbi:MAG TPA: periplasmic heavy metal sensor [Armatimonadota bacterium]|nr:periplasmic heavy metal sensor [Armatimonadota bacterium]
MKRIYIVLAAIAVIVAAFGVVWAVESAPANVVPKAQTSDEVVVSGGGMAGGFGGGVMVGPGGPGGPGGPPMMMQPEPICPAAAVDVPVMWLFASMQHLQLTEEQAQVFAEIMDTSEARIAPLRKKAQDAFKAVSEAMMADEFDAKKVETLIAASEKAEAAFVAAEYERWKQIRALLTPEQFKIVKETIRHMPGPGNGPIHGPMHGPANIGPGQPPRF